MARLHYSVAWPGRSCDMLPGIWADRRPTGDNHQRCLARELIGAVSECPCGHSVTEVTLLFEMMASGGCPHPGCAPPRKRTGT